MILDSRGSGKVFWKVCAMSYYAKEQTQILTNGKDIIGYVKKKKFKPLTRVLVFYWGSR